MPSIFQALLEGTVACNLSRRPSWRGQLIAIFFRRPCLVGDCCFPFFSWTLFGGGHVFAIFSAGPTWRGTVGCYLFQGLFWAWDSCLQSYCEPYLEVGSCLPSFSRALLCDGYLFSIFFAGSFELRTVACHLFRGPYWTGTFSFA